MEKYQLRSILLILFLFLVIIVLSFFDNDDNIPPKLEEPITELSSELPYTVEVYERDTKPDIIAYRVFFDFMGTLEKKGIIDSKSFTRFTKLSGDEEEFVVAVVFRVSLPEGHQEMGIDWGEVNENGVTQDIVWKLTIKRVENLTYSLTKIEETTDLSIGLPPVESMEEYHEEAGVEDSSDADYKIENEVLKVTYDNGQSWQQVPVEMEQLFGGEYNGSKQELIEDSYIITPERTAFVLGGFGSIRILQSTDKGSTWEETLVSDQLPVVRMRILGFTSKKDGYLIVTGDRTMSSEMHVVYKTNDGGRTWHNSGAVDEVYSLVKNGAFINDQLGFISFGEYHHEDNPPRPYLFRTNDGGDNWERVDIPIPEEYEGYFTMAENPTSNGEQLTLLVNQGPVGDYLGGKVLAKFISEDEGKTWSFAGLVDPDGVLLDE